MPVAMYNINNVHQAVHVYGKHPPNIKVHDDDHVDNAITHVFSIIHVMIA